MKTIKELAKQALEVQDACNLVALAGEFHRVVLEMQRQGLSVREHPVTRCWIDKLASLTDTQDLGNPIVMEAFRECSRIAEGGDESS